MSSCWSTYLLFAGRMTKGSRPQGSPPVAAAAAWLVQALGIRAPPLPGLHTSCLVALHSLHMMVMCVALCCTPLSSQLDVREARAAELSAGRLAEGLALQHARLQAGPWMLGARLALIGLEQGLAFGRAAEVIMPGIMTRWATLSDCKQAQVSLTCSRIAAKLVQLNVPLVAGSPLAQICGCCTARLGRW